MVFTILIVIMYTHQKSKYPRTHHDWLLINCGSLLNYKGPGFRTLSFKLSWVFPESILRAISADQLSWPSDSLFKRYTQKCEPTWVLIPAMTSQFSKLAEWFKIWKWRISQEQNITFPWIKTFWIVPQRIYFQKL